jgi:Short C-terminal domain/Phospholipase_D-nuclease N-terminal
MRSSWLNELTQGTPTPGDASGKEVEELNLGELLWGMLVFFFWFMAIWIFIQIFADIFHRRDLSGAGKAGWIVLLFILPFLGALIYLIARPKMTEQDREDIRRMQAAQQRASGYSPADEIEKLSKLRDSGEISAEEYERMKSRALADV